MMRILCNAIQLQDRTMAARTERIQGRLIRAAAIALTLSVHAATQALPQQATAAIPYNQTFVTKHTGVFGGERISYTATVAPTILADSAGVPAVNFVSTSYVRDGVRDPKNRPVIFAFAGGPSNASTAYHMRILGPRRIMDPPPEREADGPQIVDNPEGLLDIADVVLVDPAGTGFSRILPAGQRGYFYSINGDVASIEQFITEWLKTHGRESSPRYIMGGSYGSVRVIRIGWDFQRAGRPVDGIIMTANSSMLQEMNGPLADATNLPTFTMVALYHGKVDRAGRTDAEIADDAYRFAMREYLGALASVQDLTPAERGSWATKLQARTGISADYFLANDLAISRQRFMAELLKDKGLVLTNNYDGRVTGRAPTTNATPAAPQNARPDPFHTYMQDELKVTYPMTEYAAAAPNTNTWNYDGPPQARRPDGGNDWPRMLRELMDKDPNVRVYSANGYQDLQSTMGQALYIFSRTKLPRDRIVVRNNVGGHALYTDPPSASVILQDLRKMLAARRPR
jgi:carboxypeptidase C (cathepsin A)